ncbi:MAG TPA: PQQ-dependent catabolism-associated CXXCW motif protein [Alphaproteobacteria bacterium]|nr:PQQ-dependent catabolism-associated CXXCW motif protein [Alphaproteobacteria bacterium]
MACCIAHGSADAGGAPEPEGYRLDDYRAPVPETVAGGRVVHTDELKGMIAQGGIVLIDVLPAPRKPEGMRPGTPWLPLPRLDIPGSLWLPDVGRGVIDQQLDRWFRARLAEATHGDPTRTLVFYCLAECWMSWNATKRASSYGYADVVWFPEGTDGWGAAGLPLAEAHPEAPPS